MDRPVDDRLRQAEDERRAREGYPVAGNPALHPATPSGAPLGASSGPPEYYVDERRDVAPPLERTATGGVPSADDYYAQQPTAAANADDYYAQQSAATTAADTVDLQRGEGERTIELREEQLVARKDLREVGEVRIRTTVETVPGRLEVEAFREEVEVEHVPVGQIVKERVVPWEEGDALVVPIYEEQLVMVKRLVLREHLRIRRVATVERRLFEDTIRRERLVVEDPSNTGLVHEQFPDQMHEDQVVAKDERTDDRTDAEPSAHEDGGFLGNLVRKALS